MEARRSKEFTGHILHAQTVTPKCIPCSTGRFHHHQTQGSELQQGRAELTAPKTSCGGCCHPRISTLFLRNGRQWELGGDWPVSTQNIIEMYFIWREKHWWPDRSSIFPKNKWAVQFCLTLLFNVNAFFENHFINFSSSFIRSYSI